MKATIACLGWMILAGQDGKELDVKAVMVDDTEWRDHELIALVAREDDLPAAAAAHRDKDAKALEKLSPPTSSDELFVYLLWGWSREGSDPRRQTKVAARFLEKEKCVKIVLTTARYVKAPEIGTSDVEYVGYGAVLGKLPAGEYAVKISEVVETYQSGEDTAPKKGEEKAVKELKFKIEK